MLENTEETPLIGLLNKIKEIQTAGDRLVQICATKIGGNYELLYTFGRDYDIRHIKVTIEPGAHVPSITDMFPAAYLYENEIHDLFGIAIDGINHDYKGGLYRTPVEAPFK
ncbi:MAG: NADH-quinone oxidoreductase subunit C [Lachnospiraceae bacterium]|nr:NADH-quinone oxidoreductase subunit C [Lachnospiraceae bacterium]MBQ9607145.1 NADH-quinone oxidoreductase subunit C [Lachnospiraceae bacterium]MBR1524939.1 NADH-quinone oxidoreductase subunit C [Lachnospiraceae bacterium]